MIRRVVLLGLVAVLGAAACSGGSDSGTGDSAGGPDPSECGLEAFESADKPVGITFWHNFTDSNEEALEAMTDEFNTSQGDVTVDLVAFPGYEDIFTKWRAGIGGGDLPTMAVMEETTLQSMIDSRSAVPVQACVDADDYSLDDFLPQAVGYYTVDDVLYSMPWPVSNPVLFYNKTLFEDAGLDPEVPPATLEEVREVSKQIVDSGVAPHGITIPTRDFINEFWYAKGGQEYVNNGNGREGRATAAQLDNEFGLELWTWWNDMVESELALPTPAQGENIDHLLAVGNREAGMTIDGSAALGPALDVLSSGEFGGVELAAAVLPGVEEGGGVPVGDGSIWVSQAATPEQRGAAWQFVKYLSEPAQQVTLHLAGGYVPTRLSAIDDPAVQARWEEEPAFRFAVEQLVDSETTLATVGSVIGDYQGVRNAVTKALEGMLTGDLTPEEALAQAQEEADTAIQEYNTRIGE
ncbi:MAG: ABC transporter substrate-binding protein [Acidimicrobiia bacterium]